MPVLFSHSGSEIPLAVHLDPAFALLSTSAGRVLLWPLGGGSSTSAPGNAGEQLQVAPPIEVAPYSGFPALAVWATTVGSKKQGEELLPTPPQLTAASTVVVRVFLLTEFSSGYNRLARVDVEYHVGAEPGEPGRVGGQAAQVTAYEGYHLLSTVKLLFCRGPISEVIVKLDAPAPEEPFCFLCGRSGHLLSLGKQGARIVPLSKAAWSSNAEGTVGEWESQHSARLRSVQLRGKDFLPELENICEVKQDRTSQSIPPCKYFHTLPVGYHCYSRGRRSGNRNHNDEHAILFLERRSDEHQDSTDITLSKSARAAVHVFQMTLPREEEEDCDFAEEPCGVPPATKRRAAVQLGTDGVYCSFVSFVELTVEIGQGHLGIVVAVIDKCIVRLFDVDTNALLLEWSLEKEMKKHYAMSTTRGNNVQLPLDEIVAVEAFAEPVSGDHCCVALLTTGGDILMVRAAGADLANVSVEEGEMKQKGGGGGGGVLPERSGEGDFVPGSVTSSRTKSIVPEELHLYEASAEEKEKLTFDLPVLFRLDWERRRALFSSDQGVLLVPLTSEKALSSRERLTT